MTRSRFTDEQIVSIYMDLDACFPAWELMAMDDLWNQAKGAEKAS